MPHSVTRIASRTSHCIFIHFISFYSHMICAVLRRPYVTIGETKELLKYVSLLIGKFFFTHPCRLQVMNLTFRNYCVTTALHVLGSRTDKAVWLPMYPISRGQLTEVVLRLGSGRQLDIIVKNNYFLRIGNKTACQSRIGKILGAWTGISTRRRFGKLPKADTPVIFHDQAIQWHVSTTDICSPFIDISK